jgi:hypothetical protein
MAFIQNKLTSFISLPIYVIYQIYTGYNYQCILEHNIVLPRILVACLETARFHGGVQELYPPWVNVHGYHGVVFYAPAM